MGASGYLRHRGKGRVSGLKAGRRVGVPQGIIEIGAFLSGGASTDQQMLNLLEV